MDASDLVISLLRIRTRDPGKRNLTLRASCIRSMQMLADLTCHAVQYQ